jgi:hypothetical protein
MKRIQILEKNNIVMKVYEEKGKKMRSFTRGETNMITNYFANISLATMEQAFGELKWRKKWE